MDKKRYDEFEMYKEKLDEMYEKDPEKATMEAYNSLVRLGAINGKTKKLSDGNFWIVCIVSVCVVIFLLGLFNIKSIMLYLFGFVFFVAGMCISLQADKGSVLFVFSHGGTGLGIMIGSLVSGIIDNPLFTDGGTNLYVYLVICGLLLLGGFLFVAISSLLNDVNMKKRLFIGLCIITGGLLLLGLFPHIMNYIYSLGV